MATSTIVITYTAASGEIGDRVTSLTVGGTAYNSLTVTDIKLARSLMEKAAKMLRSPAVNSTVASPRAGGTDVWSLTSSTGGTAGGGAGG